METWLKDHLIAAGHLTENGATRRARAVRCPRCREVTVLGMDDTRCALEVRADPVPLSPLGEALALITGRRTVVVHREAGRFVLDPRDDQDIVSRPAGSAKREDVLRSHRCDDYELPAALSAQTTFTEAVPPLPPGSPAPF